MTYRQYLIGQALAGTAANPQFSGVTQASLALSAIESVDAALARLEEENE